MTKLIVVAYALIGFALIVRSLLRRDHIDNRAMRLRLPEE